MGSEEKKKKLEKEFNVTKCFNYKNPEEENFGELILKLTNNSGVDLVLDCVGANYWQKNLECLSLDGEWVLYGLMSDLNSNTYNCTCNRNTSNQHDCQLSSSISPIGSKRVFGIHLN